MRKLILQMQQSLDGFVCGPSGEMDWLTFNWDEELNSYVAALMKDVDTIVIGRKLAEGFIPHWISVANDPVQGRGAAEINAARKTVFSHTLESTDWPNSEIAELPLEQELAKLKSAEGGDLITYGGVEMANSLVKANLIDEYYLFINPAAIGQGRSIFSNLPATFKLNLVESKSFSCGVTVLKYVPAV